MKKIVILGSTGSIGTQTLQVVDNLKDYKVVALTAHTNVELIEKQARKYLPEKVVMLNEDAAELLAQKLSDTDITVLFGMEGLLEVATSPSVDVVVNALVGNIGLEPTVAAIKAKKQIALANKETLVTSGEIIMKLLKENHVSMLPIDSEHSAILQCLRGNENNEISKIILTASGGPFRGKTTGDLKKVTAKDALKHPNWSMGAKITIDSATLMNKGLEVIEAKWLFDLKKEQIQPLVHPQSVIHSMVEFCDGSIIAQLGEPDMKVPIQYALSYPNRPRNSFPKVDFLLRNHLTFEEPDLLSFPCLRLAFDAIAVGGTMPTVMNAANEVLVDLFLKEKISFLQIPELIELAMNTYTVKYSFDICDVLDADKWGRAFILDRI